MPLLGQRQVNGSRGEALGKALGMGCEDQTEPAGALLLQQHGPHLGLGHGVQHRGYLVRHQVGGVRRKGAGDAEPLQARRRRARAGQPRQPRPAPNAQGARLSSRSAGPASLAQGVPHARARGPPLSRRVLARSAAPGTGPRLGAQGARRPARIPPPGGTLVARQKPDTTWSCPEAAGSGQAHSLPGGDAAARRPEHRHVPAAGVVHGRGGGLPLIPQVLPSDTDGAAVRPARAARGRPPHTLLAGRRDSGGQRRSPVAARRGRAGRREWIESRARGRACHRWRGYTAARRRSRRREASAADGLLHRRSPAQKHRHPVGDGEGQLQVVGDEQHARRRSSAKLPEVRHGRPGQVQVQPRGGLVGHDELRVVHRARSTKAPGAPCRRKARRGASARLRGPGRSGRRAHAAEPCARPHPRAARSPAPAAPRA